MSALRTGLVLATKVAARRPHPAVLTQAARTLGTAATLKKREVIAEKEVPVSSYTPDGRGTMSGSSHGQQYSIPVRKDPKVQVPAEDHAERVVPLNQAGFQRLPATLQRMTVMGKVAIITG
jgi:hypothetical protein